MLHLSHSSSPVAEQEPRGLKDSPDTFTVQEERVRELEAKVSALQGLVCHLLEANERLRIRLRAS